MAKQKGRRLPPAVTSFLRDLAVALLLVAIVFAALIAFARAWPPMVVVESGSMQHSDTESSLGVVDTGDIVVVQAAPLRQDIVTYVQGRATGYTTYGDFGDVTVFRDPDVEGRWIIHRALVFLAWNEETMGFDVPELESLVRGRDWDSNAATAYGLHRGHFILLRDVGFRHRDVMIIMDSFLAQVDPTNCPDACGGYVTMGDNNAPRIDEDLVFPGLVLGRARGEVPWFGLLKLTLAGNFAWGDRRAPSSSWTFLTVALVVLVALPIGLDVGLSLASRRSDEEPANPGESREEASGEGEHGSSEEGEDAAK